MYYSYYCMDVQRTSSGVLRDVEAYCQWPKSARLYREVRPLHIVAAILLAAAVATLFWRKDMRHSTHGWALATHAACLLLTNTLHFSWLYTPYDDSSCVQYAYPIYFFHLAGAFWLNAVAANMTYGFRQPLGALARSGDGGWRRFCLLSAYAWGIPIVLTTFAALMRTYEMEMINKGYITPEFFETRTCSVDTTTTDLPSGGSFYMLRSILYYYLPFTVLVVANIVCLILTLRRIRELQKDSGFLQSTSRPHRSTVLYVKLLLSAGVLELLMETIAIAVILDVQGSKRYSTVDIRLQYHVYEAHNIFGGVSTFLDFSRAAAVLWLCVRDWEWVGKSWNWLWGRIHQRNSATQDSSTGVRSSQGTTKETEM